MAVKKDSIFFHPYCFYIVTRINLVLLINIKGEIRKT